MIGYPVISSLRIGFGEDSHRLVSTRRLVICGVDIPNSPHWAEAVSDGDVLLHALADSLLSSFAEGDIGDLFPPCDSNSIGLSSKTILAAVLKYLRSNHGYFTINNLAGTVTIDKPKLGPHRLAIREQIASLTNINPSQVGVTFKTSEGLSPDHVQARVSVLIATSTEP